MEATVPQRQHQRATSKAQSLTEKANRALGVQPADALFSKTYMIGAFIALLIGGIFGLLQVLVRGGVIDTLPLNLNYYQVLTGHGVMMVVVFSTLFVIGYCYAGMSHTLGGLLPKVRKMAWIGFGLKVVGVAMASVAILAGDASVMYTFYPPMAAVPYFYIGLVFAVLGIWMCAFGAFINVAHWRKAHPGQRVPILSYFATGIFVLMFFGSLPVAIEVFMIIPWSLGWVDTINVMVSRTLFWAFGHTYVNIWYMTAVSAWYVIIPKIIGGKRFNDTITRVMIVMLVILNITGGFHHQIVDPGISESVKFMHVFMSLAIGFPSLMTAYAMFSVFEKTARKLGGKGIVGWYKKMPWKDVRFLSPFIAMVAFIPAGAGGIVQSTNQLDQVVHNTLWITGHFHLTLGMTVVMTFFGITYWLIPHLTKRKLTPFVNRLGLIQTALWTVGMSIMAISMHVVGLFGAPRRTAFSDYGGSLTAAAWDPYLMLVVIGGSILVVAGVLQLYAVYHMFFRSPKGETEFPIAETEAGEATPYWTERWGLWIVLMIIVVTMAYIIPLTDFIVNAPPGSPTFRTW